MEQREEAILCFREALARDAGHAMARHLLHSLTGENAPERASDGYVRQLFDTFAKTFDRSLVRDLQYSVPALIGVAADATAAGRAAPLDILDLGCGTGLCGPLLRPLAGTLVGVDLSPRMLEAAKARGCYDELVEAEIVAWLGRRHAAFDLVTAADVFVYFGDIAPACAAVFDVLRPAGVFIFSVERHEGEPGFRLHGHGRYSHREPFLRASAEGAGFDLVRLEPITPRLDGGEPVDGYLVELKKPT
jgi:predicted TPR repeat methyltransferase